MNELHAASLLFCARVVRALCGAEALDEREIDALRDTAMRFKAEIDRLRDAHNRLPHVEYLRRHPCRFDFEGE